MANRYGITTQGTARTQEFTVWEGDFMSSPVGYGTLRPGARRTTVTLLDYAGTKIRVSLPAGVTPPRTDHNYLDLDAAILDAVAAHYLQSRQDVEMPPHPLTGLLNITREEVADALAATEDVTLVRADGTLTAAGMVHVADVRRNA